MNKYRVHFEVEGISNSKVVYANSYGGAEASVCEDFNGTNFNISSINTIKLSEVSLEIDGNILEAEVTSVAPKTKKSEITISLNGKDICSVSILGNDISIYNHLSDAGYRRGISSLCI